MIEKLVAGRAVKIQVKRVFDPGHGYLRRVRARVALVLGKRWHAAPEIGSLGRPWQSEFSYGQRLYAFYA